jgi:hypothetical protein
MRCNRSPDIADSVEKLVIQFDHMEFHRYKPQAIVERNSDSHLLAIEDYSLPSHIFPPQDFSKI